MIAFPCKENKSTIATGSSDEVLSTDVLRVFFFLLFVQYWLCGWAHKSGDVCRRRYGKETQECTDFPASCKITKETKGYRGWGERKERGSVPAGPLPSAPKRLELCNPPAGAARCQRHCSTGRASRGSNGTASRAICTMAADSSYCFSRNCRWQPAGCCAWERQHRAVGDSHLDVLPGQLAHLSQSPDVAQQCMDMVSRAKLAH